MMASEASITGDLDSTIIKYSPFFSEIRKRLIFTLSVFIICAVVGFIYYENIIRFVLRIFDLKGVNIVFTSPFQFFTLAVDSALLVGFIAILPIVIFQILSFLKPALRRSEYKAVLALLPITLLLFISGFIFGVLIMKYVVIIFFQKSVELNIGNLLDISKLLSQILTTALLMGLAFEFPVVLTILMKLKILKYHAIVKKRLLVYILSLIFAALLPPTDLLSLVLLFLPLALLFELTLLLNRYVLKSHLL
ncbi:MAG: twin-arginine translocase subunit TatC [Candidatus Daviesbacteria bacterium]|nr:twin-arginine translocase subunit TatC [Candidatus Daviesbacteria bacterium]